MLQPRFATRLSRYRQSQGTIVRYVRVARKADARLILEIHPGRASISSAVRALERWLRELDVDLALDAEWSGAPRRTQGSVSAREVNGAHDSS